MKQQLKTLFRQNNKGNNKYKQLKTCKRIYKRNFKPSYNYSTKFKHSNKPKYNYRLITNIQIKLNSCTRSYLTIQLCVLNYNCNRLKARNYFQNKIFKVSSKVIGQKYKQINLYINIILNLSVNAKKKQHLFRNNKKSYSNRSKILQ